MRQPQRVPLLTTVCSVVGDSSCETPCLHCHSMSCGWQHSLKPACDCSNCAEVLICVSFDRTVGIEPGCSTNHYSGLCHEMQRSCLQPDVASFSRLPLNYIDVIVSFSVDDVGAHIRGAKHCFS